MEINDIIQAIGSLGFPIVCTIGLFRFVSKTFAVKMDEIEKILYEIKGSMEREAGGDYGE